MSGRKRITVTITEREYERLRARERKLREIQRNLPEVLEEIRRESRRNLQTLERRQQQFQQALRRIGEDFQELEAETSRRLQEQQRRMRDAIQNVRQEMRTLLAEQERQFNEIVAQERRRREQQVRHLQEQIDAILADECRKEEMARSWIDAAQVMRDFIEGNYRHQQFKPGELERLERAIRQAQENQAQGVFEAALAQAQQAYHDLSDLRLELERLEYEWNLWRSAAMESAEEILALAQRNRRCKAVDMEGQEMDIEVEVDWWTEGRLSALEEEVNRLTTQIRDETSPPSTDELRRIVEQTVPELRQRLEKIVQDARLAVLGSQLRINIADLVVQALEEQGFSIQDATYEGEDMRGGYFAKVKHLDGSEVVVVVNPKPEQPLENELNIHSYDVDQRSEHELRHRSAELARALRVKGLQVAEPERLPERPDESLRDIKQVRKRLRVQRAVPRA